MVLVGSAAVIWLAVSIAGSDETDAKKAANRPTDLTGATISDEDLKQFADFAERK